MEACGIWRSKNGTQTSFLVCVRSYKKLAERKSITVLSRASGHDNSQLKHQNSRVGSCTEEVLEWFNNPHASAHHGCKVSCQGTELTSIIASPVLRWGQSDSGESCVVLENGLTLSLIAKLPQHSSFAVHANFVLQATNAANEAMDGCVWTFAAGCCGAWSTSCMWA